MPSKISGYISLKAAELLGLADVNRVTEYRLNRPVAQHQTDAASDMDITLSTAVIVAEKAMTMSVPTWIMDFEVTVFTSG